MSIATVLDTVRDCLADETVGLSSQLSALASDASSDPTRIRLDFNVVKWKLGNVAQTSTQPNVMLRPRRWDTQQKRAAQRDGLVAIDVAVEWFEADTDVLQDNVTLAATALARVLDALRDYSDAHNGTVIDVLDPITFAFGEFEGPVSSGFVATIQIEERSTNE
jgi:hypothetical protein